MKSYMKLVALALLIISAIVFIIGLAHYSTRKDVCNSPDQKQKFLKFLDKVQDSYYVLNPQKIAYKPLATTDDVRNFAAHYDCRPESIKSRTDKAKELHDELVEMKSQVADALNLRESKALAQVEHYLQTNFGEPFDEDYYTGVWMLGPNLWCWQPICYINSDLKSKFGIRAYHPYTSEDMTFVVDTIKKYAQSALQYIENLKMGVEAGMVRSDIECDTGINSIKGRFPGVARNGKQGILSESYVAKLRDEKFLTNITDSTALEWKSKHGKLPNETIDDVLVNNLGSALHQLIVYLQDEHRMHCIPPEVNSGLAGLPLDYIWLNGTEDRNRPTTKKLPTGEALNGKEAYKKILPYFTTTSMTPDEIYELGQRQLDILYPQALQISKELTGKINDTQAAIEFKRLLDSPDMFFNDQPIPANESDSNAHDKCISMETAEIYCPVRHASMLKWFDYVRSALRLIEAKTRPLFYFTKQKATAPNCPVKMVANFNPSTGSQSYSASGSSCPRPGWYRLPFFLALPGPIYNAYSVAGHEGRPGHHTQVQGFWEHFVSPKKTNDAISWLNKETYYTAFTEGWALYAENPLLAQETDLYLNEPLQKYGMLKWQIWRALRLIIDTGLHYRGMKRSEALSLFEKYAYDTTDKAIKDVTRYQSAAGQATAYMIGQLAIWKIRNDTKQQLEAANIKFDQREFHYYVLSQGSSPLSYLESYMKKFTKCKIDSTLSYCDEIFNRKTEDTTTNSGFSRDDGLSNDFELYDEAKRNRFTID